MLNLISFKEKCNGKYCPRGPRTKSKSCKNDSKQERCFLKYEKVQNSQKEKQFVVDDAWEDLKKLVWGRDGGECQLWKILTKEERLFVITNYMDDFSMLNTLDVAHIKGKGAYPALKYEISNVTLIRRFFHSLLDTHKHPVTRKTINKEEREAWFQSAFDGKRSKLIK